MRRIASPNSGLAGRSMFFNSQIFLFGFLPIVLVGFYTAGRFSITAAKVWLITASLFFYGWWNAIYLPLLLFSMAVNYGLGYLIQHPRRYRRQPSRRVILIFGLAFNIGLLGYFKYFNFFIDNINALFGANLVFAHVVLPLAISFFTFQKIAYLVDSYSGKLRHMRPVDYMLFVGFFPQLIAGPIVHYDDVVPQFQQSQTYRFSWENFGDGAVIFLLGLAKKVVLADELGHYADAGFGGVAAGADITAVAAWVSVLGYALQLYFDFSGYSDMAIGLARMLNIELPLNFFSPYKSASIIEFWRRWHMTLSRFLRDYIYIPLGGNRRGKPRRYANLMATMAIGGIWHGAGWNFLIWGVLHGLYLCINHLWFAVAVESDRRWRRVLGWCITFFAVTMAWVLFRAPSFSSAKAMYAGLFGAHGALLPDQFLTLLPPLRHVFSGAPNVPMLGSGTVMGVFVSVFLVAMAFGIAVLAPNIYQMTRRQRLIVLIVCFAFTLQRVLFAGHASSFLYFQF